MNCNGFNGFLICDESNLQLYPLCFYSDQLRVTEVYFHQQIELFHSV